MHGNVANNVLHLDSSLLVDYDIFHRGYNDRVFSFSDLISCGAIINHIAVCEILPPWVLPRFLAFNCFKQMSAEGQRRWLKRLIQDRLKLLWKRLWERLSLMKRINLSEPWLYHDLCRNRLSRHHSRISI